MALALFDLDETLLPVDSDYLWSTFMVDKGYISDKNFLVQKDLFKQEYVEGRLDIHVYIAFMAEYLNVLGSQRHCYQEEFIKEVIEPNIIPASVKLVEHHRYRGDVTVIITATNEFIVNDIARFFKVDHIISSELQTKILDGEVHYTGKSKGTPSFREGKIERVESFLASHPQYSWKGSYFYSDSRNDLPLLEKVEHPIAVNPDPVLLKQAQLRGWDVLDLHGNEGKSINYREK